MSEQIILCPHCGQSIQSDSTFCPFCGQSVELKSYETKPQYITNDVGSFNYLGLFFKLLLLIGVPAYFLYLGYNIMFKVTETAEDYGMDYIIMKQGMSIQFFIFGLGAFLLLFLFVTIIYAEIILNKLSKIDKNKNKWIKKER